MIIRHTVEDFAKWKAIYDEHAKERAAHGSQGGTIFRGPDNEVVALINWTSAEGAQAFSQSDNLRQAMQRAGVTSAPTMYMVEKEEEFGA